jgi:hypothetical protein
MTVFTREDFTMLRHFSAVVSLVVFSLTLILSNAVAQAWTQFSFKGTEHFKYSIKSIQNGEEKTGFFTLDVQKVGDDKYKVSFSSALGENEASSSVTSTLEELPGKLMMSMMMSGSESGIVLGATLFTPVLGFALLGGSDFEVGSGWTRTEDGKKLSFKVEAKDNIAGREGYRCVYREDDKVKYLHVIDPELGLPLKTEITDDDGNHNIVELVEFKQ